MLSAVTSAGLHSAADNYSAGISMLLHDLAGFGNGCCWHSADFSMHSICVYKFYAFHACLDLHGGSINSITYCDLTINRVWSVLALSQRIQNFSHVPSCSLGSYYPRTVELSSPKLNAHKPELGPLLL